MGMRTAFRGLRLIGNRMMANDTNQQPLAYRPREAAKVLGISERTLWQLTHDGKIPCVRLGTGKRRAVLYPVAALQTWLTQAAGTDRRDGANGGEA